MSFESWSAFLDMGGHGLYVWLSYGAGVLVLLGNLVGSVTARRRLVARLRSEPRSNEVGGSHAPGP